MKGLYSPSSTSAILSVRGKDRAVFLHRLLSNDIKGLQPGQAKPACLLDRQGKVVFCCLALARPDEILLELAPELLETALAALNKYLVSEAVELSDATSRFRVMSAHGPAIETVSIPQESGFTVQFPLLGMPGAEYWVEADKAAEAIPRIEAALRAAGLQQGTPEDFEALRIQAGLPMPGKEITQETILNELGREDFVSYTKGCYIGQEIVARIKYRAHPPRLLTGFILESPEVPREGSPVLHQGQEVGTVTSACFSPTLGKPVALGFLKHGVETEEFQIAGRPAKRTKLPFVQPSTSLP